jgi:hypothetical protein
MDPGTALAVVSIVYEVTKDLYSFYCAWKDCDDDVKELRQQLLAVHSMFCVLGPILKRNGFAADLANPVYDAISHCEDVAKDL